MDKQKSAHVADISQRNGATADTVRVPSAARVTIVRSRLTACLVVLDVVLAVASIPSHLVSYYRPDATFEPITRRFSGELSIPAWYSAMLLAACALLLWTIARVGMAAVDRWRFHWLFMAVVFLLLSLDEIIGVHEMSMEPMDKVIAPHGLLYYTWVVPWSLLVLAFVGICLPFLRSLPRRWAVRFIVAGAIYVGGAMGFEVIGGVYLDARYGVEQYDWLYALIDATEELLEMLGVTLFLQALLGYLADQIGPLTFMIRD